MNPKLAAALVKWGLRLALVAAIMAVGALAWHRLPVIGPAAVIKKVSADRDNWHKSADDWKRTAGGWESSFRSAEGRRSSEQQTAQAAADALSQQCTARVAEARRAGAAIHTITHQDPPTNAQGCPIRQLVPADSLRDALQPASPTH
jgi:hypothetical protein